MVEQFELDLDVGWNGISIPNRGGFVYLNCKNLDMTDHCLVELTHFTTWLKRGYWQETEKYGAQKWNKIIPTLDDEQWATEMMDSLADFGRFFVF